MFRDMAMRSWLEKGKAEMDEGSRYPRDVPPLPSRASAARAAPRRQCHADRLGHAIPAGGRGAAARSPLPTPSASLARCERSETTGGSRHCDPLVVPAATWPSPPARRDGTVRIGIDMLIFTDYQQAHALSPHTLANFPPTMTCSRCQTDNREAAASARSAEGHWRSPAPSAASPTSRATSSVAGAVRHCVPLRRSHSRYSARSLTRRSISPRRFLPSRRALKGDASRSRSSSPEGEDRQHERPPTAVAPSWGPINVT
jgi:hypothetical protein